MKTIQDLSANLSIKEIKDPNISVLKLSKAIQMQQQPK